MTDSPVPWTRWAALAALIAGAAAVLPRMGAVFPADVAARVALGVAWLALLALAWLGAGRAVLGLAGLAGEFDLGVVIASGAAALSLAATALAAVGSLRPAVLVALFALAAVAGAVGWARGYRPRAPWRGARPWAWVLLGLPALVQVLGLTAPPVFYDSLNYHLAFPERWLAAGGWVEFPRHAYSYYPAAMGSLYTYALATVGGWGTRAVHLLLGWTAALVAAALGRRLGGGRAAWWAAALFLLTPSVLQTGPLAVADLGVAAWGGAALLAVAGMGEDGRPLRSASLAGLLAGCAVGAKYLAGATVALPVLAALLVTETRGLRRVAGASLALGVGAVAGAGPWLLRNFLWTGDPVYPYFAPLFGLPAQGMNLAGELAQNGPGALGPVLGTLLALPLRTVHPLQVGGVIGPLWVLLLVPAMLLVRAGRARTLWAAAVTGLLGWGALVQFGRFLLPVLVPLAALCGAAAARLVEPQRRRDPVAPLVGALLAVVLAWNASAVLDPLACERLSVVAGAETDGEFLAHWVSYWPAVDGVERTVPPGGRVLLLGESRCYGITSDVLVEDPYHPPLLVELAGISPDPRALAGRLRDMGVTHILVNRTEMERIARMRGLPDYFAEASPAARPSIRAFLAGLPVVWSRGPLTLLLLPPGPAPHSSTPASPGRRAQGTWPERGCGWGEGTKTNETHRTDGWRPGFPWSVARIPPQRWVGVLECRVAFLRLSKPPSTAQPGDACVHRTSQATGVARDRRERAGRRFAFRWLENESVPFPWGAEPWSERGWTLPKILHPKDLRPGDEVIRVMVEV